PPPFLSRLRRRVVEIRLLVFAPREIRIVEFRRFALLDAKLLRQSKWRESVDDSEIDRLRRPPVFRSLCKRPNAKNFLRRASVNVFSVSERLDEHGIFGKMRHHTQFDLRIVRGQQHLPFFRNKSCSNLAPELRSYRNILQIRIARAQSSRRRNRL